MSELPISAVKAAQDDASSDARSTASEDSSSSNEEGWEDIEPDNESQPVIGLFSDKVYPDIISMLEETKMKHNFDLRGIKRNLGG